MSIVRLYFTDGVSNYTFPCVQSVSDPKEGMKATIIPGTRGDGSIVISGGKKSPEISIRGIIFNNTGYNAITTAINAMKAAVTTNPATLSMQEYIGGTWVNDWSYQVIRTEPIDFADSMRTVDQPYTAKFLITSF